MRLKRPASLFVLLEARFSQPLSRYRAPFVKKIAARSLGILIGGSVARFIDLGLTKRDIYSIVLLVGLVMYLATLRRILAERAMNDIHGN